MLSPTDPSSRSVTRPLAVLTTLFFMWGFMTVMNDVLIPHLKSVFRLSYSVSMLVQSFFFGAYFIGSIVYWWVSRRVGDPIQRLGYKRGLIAGLLLSALGSALFVPATYMHLYEAYLVALFVLGLGFTLLQIAANPFVAIIGPVESASSRLNLAQAFNSLGTTLAPIIGGALIFRHFAGDQAVRWPYLFFAGLLLLQAVVVHFITLPEPASVVRKYVPVKSNALRYPQLRWGMVAIFCYVGAEVAIGSLLISFAGLPDILGLTPDEAKVYTALYWGGAMIGRFLGAMALRVGMSLVRKAIAMIAIAGGLLLLLFAILHAEQGISPVNLAPMTALIGLNILGFMLVGSRPAKALLVFALSALMLVLFGAFTSGSAALWALTGIGLFNSIMWSNIFTLAIDGLGDDTAQGSSLLVMMILGGALVPLAQAAIADSSAGLQTSFLLIMICYAYLAWYGLKGHRHA